MGKGCADTEWARPHCVRVWLKSSFNQTAGGFLPAFKQGLGCSQVGCTALCCAQQAAAAEVCVAKAREAKLQMLLRGGSSSWLQITDSSVMGTGQGILTLVR